MEKLRLDRDHEKEEREDIIRLETLEREDRMLREKLGMEEKEKEKQGEMTREKNKNMRN